MNINKAELMNKTKKISKRVKKELEKTITNDIKPLLGLDNKETEQNKIIEQKANEKFVDKNIEEQKEYIREQREHINKLNNELKNRI